MIGRNGVHMHSSSFSASAALHIRRVNLRKLNLARILLAFAFALAMLAVGYFAGAAAASGLPLDKMGLLAQLQSDNGTELFSRAMKLLKAKYYLPINEEQQQKLIYGGIQGMLAGLHEEPFKDEFSHFYDPELYADLQAQTTGEYAGIGILMGLTADGMYPEIVTVFPGTPAEDKGLQPDDVITEVAGEDAFGMILPEVATRIKGEPGTTVKLKLFRPADGEFQELEVERREVIYSSIAKKELLDGGVGYVEISSFAEDTGKDFRAAMEELSAQNMTSLIIDLRNNTGGLLDAAVEVADCFIAEGAVVEVASRDTSPQVLNVRKDSKKYKLPIVILINANTASASEVLTGALRDYGLARTVGETSFGKGVVQEVIPMETEAVERRESDGQIHTEYQAKSALAVTIAKYYTPLHKDIHGIGIDPDIWYNGDNMLADDPKLQKMQDTLDAKVAELRQLRGQITAYVRTQDYEKKKATAVAQALARGEAVPNVARLPLKQEEHSPLDSAMPPADDGKSDAPQEGAK
jgi:carboxyl-terminal processing protease